MTPLALGITNPTQVQAAASEVESLDILINNAGSMLPDDPLNFAALERHLAVNLFGSNEYVTHFAGRTGICQDGGSDRRTV